MKVFLLDNFDSFTYNIVQMLQPLGIKPVVSRNTDITLPELSQLSPDKIIISPGPMRPYKHNLIFALLEEFYRSTPVLGICLGMQAINEHFGGKLARAPVPVHGKTSRVFHRHEGIFKGVPSPFRSARYHSLVISDMPGVLRKTAETEDGIPMAIEHRQYPLFGVQFHPESYLSRYGKKIMQNFLEA